MVTIMCDELSNGSWKSTTSRQNPSGGAGSAKGIDERARAALSGPRVAIIVLNWNGKKDTLECLESLRHIDYANHEIVAVDQNSADGSGDAIGGAFPDVTLIQNEENLGFAEGNNVGIRYALSAGAEYVALLNNDTTVASNFVRALVDAARAMPDFDIFGPKIVFYKDPNLIWAAGSAINWRRGTCMQRGYGEVDRGQYDTPTEVNALTGCAMMIHRKVFETIGLFDGRFYLYYEETDWCARAQRAGFRLLYVPAPVVRHKVSSTIGAASPTIVFYMVRNNLLFIAKNGVGLRRLWLLARALLAAGRTICSGLVKGRRKDAVVRMRAVAAFLGRRFGKAEV
jgi:GT2 family glycosyltransferase